MATQNGNVTVTRQEKPPTGSTALATNEPTAGGAALARPTEQVSPFTAMRRWMDEMERSFFGRPMSSMLSLFDTLGEPLSTQATRGGWMPQLEVFEDDGRLIVRADLPGLKPEDVRVDVADGVLTLSGERRLEHEVTKNGVFHSERSYGSFQRSVSLPDGVTPDAIAARFEDGVLEITMPAPEPKARGRRIEVKASRKEAKRS